MKINAELLSLHCVSSFPFSGEEPHARGVLMRTFAALIQALKLAASELEFNLALGTF